MPFAESKVYFDGSHYIAIPKTTRPARKRIKPPEEIIVIEEKEELVESSINSSVSNNDNSQDNDNTAVEIEDKKAVVKNKVLTTKKALFDKLYKDYVNEPKKRRKSLIIKRMLPYFKTEKDCELFVEINIQRKLRNLICRRVRMVRKANLANFNYFVTFTYDNKKHIEISFKKKLKIALQNLSTRKGWKYMGVWERAPETNRLHFHGLFYIPENSMVGKLEEYTDYSFDKHHRIKTYQNTYFNERFGRSDFKPIISVKDMSKEITYLMKYIEKTGEKIVYSRGLYQYFISDIMEEDVVTRIGQEDKKLLLFDDFKCWDEGCLIGKVSPDVIQQMRKSN